MLQTYGFWSFANASLFDMSFLPYLLRVNGEAYPKRSKLKDKEAINPIMIPF